MKYIFITLCLFLSSLALATESLQLEHLMLVVPEDVQKPSMPNFHVYRSEDSFLNERLLNFNEILMARSSSELVVKNYVVVPRFQLKSFNLPHQELMYFENGELFIRHIIDDGKRLILSKIASSGRYSTFSSPDLDGKYQNFRIYELNFEKGIEITQGPVHRIVPGSEFILNIEKRLEDEEKDRKLQKLRATVFENFGNDITRSEIKRLKSLYPGLKDSINEMLDLLEIQLLEARYTRPQAKRFLKEFEAYLYSLSKNVQRLNHKNNYSITKDTAQIFLKDRHAQRFQQDHVDDRVIDLMKLFFDTIDQLDEARKVKNTSLVEKYSLEAMRIISEVYLTTGKTFGSIGQQKTYTGLISMAGSLGFAVGAFLLEGVELKMGLGLLSAALFTHSLYELYSRQFSYKKSFLNYPGVEKLVQKLNAKEIRSDRVNLGYEIAVRGNEKYMYKNSSWYNFAIENNILSNEFMDKVFKIIELASGKDISFTVKAMNASYSCRKLF